MAEFDEREQAGPPPLASDPEQPGLAPGASPITAAPGTYAWAVEQIRNTYRVYLGREPSMDEINAHTGDNSPGQVAANIQNIRTGPEATARSRNPAATQVAPTMGDAARGTLPQGGQWGADYEWQGPEAGGVAAGDPSRLTGFNTAGWGTGERGTASFKNTFGRMASRYDPRAAGSLDAMLSDPEFRRFYPNARKVGPDKIDFGDGRPVDVWRNYDDRTGAGDAWAWQTMDAPGAPPATKNPTFNVPLPPGTMPHPMPGAPGGPGTIPSPPPPPAPQSARVASEEPYRPLVAPTMGELARPQPAYLRGTRPWPPIPRRGSPGRFQILTR